MHFVSLLWFISEEKLEILLALFNKAENKQQQQQQQQGEWNISVIYGAT